MKETPREIHEQALIAREEEQDIIKALHLGIDARLAYLGAGDYQGLAEVLSNDAITYHHLAEQFEGERDQEKRRATLLLAEADMFQALKIAELSNNPDALIAPNFNLGKVKAYFGQFLPAIVFYERAISYICIDPSHPEPNPVTNPFQNRPTVLADIKVHREYARYYYGNPDAKAARGEMERDLEELENAVESDNEAKLVWLSGGYLKLAEIWLHDDPQKAQFYFHKAGSFITEHPRLALRKKEWKALRNQYGS